MSRRCTLDEYLEGVVDEHTESAEEEMRLLVTDAQVHAVGLFFIDGMVGLIQCLRNERGTALPRETKDEQSDVVTDEVATDRDDFIN
ncbi:MAG TPA: hypothetical protein VI306_04975 [Pyrinomonadaceae bacterium]